MNSLAFSVGNCHPRKLISPLVRIVGATATEPSNVKLLSRNRKAFLLNNSSSRKTKLLSRKEAIGLVFCAGIFLDTFLQLQPSIAAEETPCELTVAPSGLAFCDKVVGRGPEAIKGQLINARYVGKLENDKVFDSCYNRGKTLTFRVGVGEGSPHQSLRFLRNMQQRLPLPRTKVKVRSSSKGALAVPH